MGGGRVGASFSLVRLVFRLRTLVLCFSVSEVEVWMFNEPKQNRMDWIGYAVRWRGWFLSRASDKRKASGDGSIVLDIRSRNDARSCESVSSAPSRFVERRNASDHLILSRLTFF
jgi:hypothetical protein